MRDDGGDGGGHVGAGDGSGADFNDKKGAEEYTVVFCGSFDRISEPRFLDEDKLPKLASLRK